MGYQTSSGRLTIRTSASPRFSVTKIWFPSSINTLKEATPKSEEGAKCVLRKFLLDAQYLGSNPRRVAHKDLAECGEKVFFSRCVYLCRIPQIQTEQSSAGHIAMQFSKSVKEPFCEDITCLLVLLIDG